jgi:ATP-dependent RNA helicase DeaD
VIKLIFLNFKQICILFFISTLLDFMMQKSTPSFSDFQFAPEIMSALDALSFQTPTPIQQQTIPFLLAGKDVLGLAQTGTGKTAAFVLPLLQKLSTAKWSTAPKALIITPTRELALQVEQHIKDLTKMMPKVESVALCGGQSYTPQVKQLKKGCSIVVGTPGRILDHIRQNTLNLSQLEYFVLDEADEMLRMGFVEDVETILESMPDQRQTALFSATMPPRIRQLVSHYLHQPEVVEIAAETMLMPKIQQLFLFVAANQKTDALIKLLSIAEEGAKIVFVRTKQQTEVVAEALVQSGLRAIALNGDLAQAMRERLIQQFRRGSADVLVATDIAARGLDVSQVTQVINYDVPGDPETYVHRIGRTGRAGRTGQSILFVEPKQSRFLNIIERHTQQRIQKMQVPSDAFIQMRQQQQFIDSIKAQMAQPMSEDYRQALTQLVNEEHYEWQDLAVAFAMMQLKQDQWVTSAESPYDVSASRPRERDRDFSNREFSSRKPRERDNDRFGKFNSSSRSRSPLKSSDQVLYRLSVGRNHGVKPGQIIGALANEGGIPGAQINGLKIFEEHATVFLPVSLSKRAVENLKKAWVCGRQLHLKTQMDMV